MKKKWAIFLALIMTVCMTIFVAVNPARAAVSDNDGVVEAGEVIDDDLFLSAETVRMDGTVNGTLLTSGATITINGIVNGDVFAGGQTVIISEGAVITGNLFAGGAAIEVDGQVEGSIAAGSASLVMGENSVLGRNLYYGGYSLQTDSGSQIARDAYMGGYQAVLDGTIDRNLYASTGAIRINGTIKEDVVLDVSEPGETPTSMTAWSQTSSFQVPDPIAPGVVVSESAQIGGSLTYTSPAQQDDTIDAVPGGGLVYQTPVPGEMETQPTPEPVQNRTVGMILNWIWSFLRTLVTLMLLGLLAAWLLPQLSVGINEVIRSRPMESLGVGTLVFFGGYLGALIIAALLLSVGILFSIVTLGGLAKVIFGVGFSGLGLAMAIFSLIVSYGSKLVIADLIGELIFGAAAPNITGRRYWAMALGVFIYSLVRSAPFLGWIVGIFATLFGLGAIWLAWRRGSGAVSVATAG